MYSLNCVGLIFLACESKIVRQTQLIQAVLDKVDPLMGIVTVLLYFKHVAIESLGNAAICFLVTRLSQKLSVLYLMSMVVGRHPVSPLTSTVGV